MSRRYPLPDLLRGFSVISMVLYHAMYDAATLLHWSVPWYWGLPGQLWQKSISCVFVLVSGFCHGFSRRPLHHAVIVLLCGELVTLVTTLVLPNERIQYGVLTCLGVCGILCTTLRRVSQHLPFSISPAFGLAVSLGMFILTYRVSYGSIGIGSIVLWSLPNSWYSTQFGALWGFPPPGFTSGDYFPILPWFFLYLTGHFLRRQLLQNPGAEPLLLTPQKQTLSKPVLWVGRHSLLIYLLHQPVLMALFYLMT